ncbi:UNVERIFIED_CONTAM: hypothetical protein Scaly_2501200 [Sesamum calycinum]|uniref:Reverse transcriptase domain-containing protein n=1 Tax=Sesamum calycinum TaxID=2727403 RepID=A0AAW2LTC6_9LAMI
MKVHTPVKRRRLPSSPAKSHECFSLELSGLGVASTVRKLKECVREYRPLLVLVSETKCGQFHFERVREKLNMFGVCVSSVGRSGGLALFWIKEAIVQLWSFSSNHIDVNILTEPHAANWRFTGFYKEPGTTRRKVVWERLVGLSIQSDAPWLCVRDFNEILFQQEKTGASRLRWQIEDFRETLLRCDLTDLGIRPFTAVEVKQAVFGMYPLKSPGLDVLLPKCPHPETVAQLRPVSLCNVVKIASKCVANKLKPLLDYIISRSQSASIPSRLITNNVLLAFELNHHLEVAPRSVAGCVALKLDMSKAYDRVECPFLRWILLRHFHAYYRKRRGGMILWYSVAASEEQLGEIRRILGLYVRVSGQEVNFGKSSMVVSGGWPEAVKHYLASILGVRLVAQHNKYLGLSAVGERSRKELFRSIRDQLWERIFGGIAGGRGESIGSLGITVLKVRYFPQGTFWDALVGSRLSLTWRRILSSRALVREGCRWVEDGERGGGGSGSSVFIGEGDSRWEVRIVKPYLCGIGRWHRPPVVGALPTLGKLARQSGGEDAGCWVSRWDDDAAGWILGVMQQLQVSDREWFFTLIWAIWQQRCKRLMEDRGLEPMGVWRLARCLLDNYRAVMPLGL